MTSKKNRRVIYRGWSFSVSGSWNRKKIRIRNLSTGQVVIYHANGVMSSGNGKFMSNYIRYDILRGYVHYLGLKKGTGGTV